MSIGRKESADSLLDARRWVMRVDNLRFNFCFSRQRCKLASITRAINFQTFDIAMRKEQHAREIDGVVRMHMRDEQGANIRKLQPSLPDLLASPIPEVDKIHGPINNHCRCGSVVKAASPTLCRPAGRSECNRVHSAWFSCLRSSHHR